MQRADPAALPWALSPTSLGLDDSLTLAHGENSVVGHDSILPFPHGTALTDRLNDLCALLLRTPVAAATVRDETALEVIGSRTAVAEQTARRLDDRNKESPSIRTAAAHLKVLDYPEQLSGHAGAGGQGTRAFPNDPARSEESFKPDNARCTICLRPAHACTRRFDELVGARRWRGDECRRSHGTCEEVRRCPMP